MEIVNTSLPRQKRTDRHHAAIPFADIPNFLPKLRERASIGRLALELLIFTAARSGEIRSAKWGEVDLDSRLWIVPGERMKAGREHVVPLSQQAVTVLQHARLGRRNEADPAELIFPGMKKDASMSDMTLTKVMRSFGLKATPHGFRSSFKDWAAETIEFPNELSEAALAHTIPNKTEAAYRRSTMLEKRRVMMKAWGAFCEGDKRAPVRAA